MVDVSEAASIATSSDAPLQEEPPKKFPKAVFFILGSELCERYAYYGMRSVLVIYLKEQLLMEAKDTKLIMHMFQALNYFLPLFGGLIADIWLGKFKTILILSIVYLMGIILIAVVPIPGSVLRPELPFVITALVTISIGSGGIKPCVSAFGGDQFGAGQEKMREKFYSIFYFCINVGAALSMVLSPIFRADVQCMGRLDCYPLAFGFPALLMIVAYLFFIIGKPLYTRIPAGGTAVVDIVRCIWHALKMKRKASQKKEHWLDHADDKYDPKYIEDVKTVLGILIIFIPLPMFWALFDQQGTTWTLQSAKMDGRVNSWDIKPDQMDSMNAILVLILIPLFTFGLYPLLAKCKLLRTPLQKICTGGVLASLAFLIGGFLQIAIESKMPGDVPNGISEMAVINTVNCKMNVRIGAEAVVIPPYDNYYFRELNPKPRLKMKITPDKSCKISSNQTTEQFINLKPSKAFTTAIIKTGESRIVKETVDQTRKFDVIAAKPFVRFIFAGVFPNGNLTTLLLNQTEKDYPQQVNFEKNSVFSSYALVNSTHKCDVCWSTFGSARCTTKLPQISVYKGGIFEFLIVPTSKKNEYILKELVAFPPVDIHVMWQTPMYILITAGEVMISITGLAFAYAEVMPMFGSHCVHTLEAPIEMKAILQAAWILNVSLGNVIVIIIVELKETFFRDAKESTYFFVFAAIMMVDMFVFALLAIRYKYVAKRIPKE